MKDIGHYNKKLCNLYKQRNPQLKMTKMRVKNSTVYSKPRALTKFKVQFKIES